MMLIGKMREIKRRPDTPRFGENTLAAAETINCCVCNKPMRIVHRKSYAGHPGEPENWAWRIPLMMLPIGRGYVPSDCLPAHEDCRRVQVEIAERAERYRPKIRYVPSLYA